MDEFFKLLDSFGLAEFEENLKNEFLNMYFGRIELLSRLDDLDIEGSSHGRPDAYLSLLIPEILNLDNPYIDDIKQALKTIDYNNPNAVQHVYTLIYELSHSIITPKLLKSMFKKSNTSSVPEFLVRDYRDLYRYFSKNNRCNLNFSLGIAAQLSNLTNLFWSMEKDTKDIYYSEPTPCQPVSPFADPNYPSSYLKYLASYEKLALKNEFDMSLSVSQAVKIITTKFSKEIFEEEFKEFCAKVRQRIFANRESILDYATKTLQAQLDELVKNSSILGEGVSELIENKDVKRLDENWQQTTSLLIKCVERRKKVDESISRLNLFDARFSDELKRAQKRIIEEENGYYASNGYYHSYSEYTVLDFDVFKLGSNVRIKTVEEYKKAILKNFVRRTKEDFGNIFKNIDEFFNKLPEDNENDDDYYVELLVRNAYGDNEYYTEDVSFAGVNKFKKPLKQEVVILRDKVIQAINEMSTEKMDWISNNEFGPINDLIKDIKFAINSSYNNAHTEAFNRFQDETHIDDGYPERWDHGYDDIIYAVKSLYNDICYYIDKIYEKTSCWRDDEGILVDVLKKFKTLDSHQNKITNYSNLILKLTAKLKTLEEENNELTKQIDTLTQQKQCFAVIVPKLEKIVQEEELISKFNTI